MLYFFHNAKLSKFSIFQNITNLAQLYKYFGEKIKIFRKMRNQICGINSNRITSRNSRSGKLLYQAGLPISLYNEFAFEKGNFAFECKFCAPGNELEYFFLHRRSDIGDFMQSLNS